MVLGSWVNEEPNEVDWETAHALKHLESMNESQLRSTIRELYAYNFMYIRQLKQMHSKEN